MFNQQTRELAFERVHTNTTKTSRWHASTYSTKTPPGVHPAWLHKSKCALAVSLLKFPNRLTVCFGDLRLSKSARVVSYLSQTTFLIFLVLSGVLRPLQLLLIPKQLCHVFFRVPTPSADRVVFIVFVRCSSEHSS